MKKRLLVVGMALSVLVVTGATGKHSSATTSRLITQHHLYPAWSVVVLPNLAMTFRYHLRTSFDQVSIGLYDRRSSTTKWQHMFTVSTSGTPNRRNWSSHIVPPRGAPPFVGYIKTTVEWQTTGEWQLASKVHHGVAIFEIH